MVLKMKLDTKKNRLATLLQGSALIGAAALWRVGATLDGGHIVADQAMNSAAVPGPEAAVVRPPVPMGVPPIITTTVTTTLTTAA